MHLYSTLISHYGMNHCVSYFGVLIQILQLVFVILYHPDIRKSRVTVDSTLWILVKTINLLIILRLIRLLPQIKVISHPGPVVKRSLISISEL